MSITSDNAIAAPPAFAGFRVNIRDFGTLIGLLLIVAVFVAVLSASLMVSGAPPVLAVVAGLALGALCGAVNGALVSFGGLQPFIVTLGTLSTYRALALIVTGGNPILGVPQ